MLGVIHLIFKTKTHLNSGLGQTSGLRELFPGVNIRILGSGKGSFQRLQLIAAESSTRSPLLALQSDSWLRFGVA